jgi:hypothetical protein
LQYLQAEVEAVLILVVHQVLEVMAGLEEVVVLLLDLEQLDKEIMEALQQTLLVLVVVELVLSVVILQAQVLVVTVEQEL